MLVCAVERNSLQLSINDFTGHICSPPPSAPNSLLYGNKIMKKSKKEGMGMDGYID